MKNIQHSYGSLLDVPDLDKFFPAFEGGIEVIYGRIRNGKTTEAVRRILEALEHGVVVYTNIPINLDMVFLDQRESPWYILRNFFFFRKLFYSFDRDNYKYIDVSKFPSTSAVIAFLSSLSDCLIVFDEGWYLLPSADFRNLDSMKLTLHTGHFNRRLIIVVQRPSAIVTHARGNVSVFYKCSKLFSWPIKIFRVDEIQDMAASEMPDEGFVVSSKLHFINRRYFKAFDTHFLRYGMEPSQKLGVRVYKVSFLERLGLFFRAVGGRLHADRRTPE